MTRTTKIITLGAILLLSFGGYWFFFRSSSTATTVNTPIRVMTGSITSTIKSTGKISPLQTSTLSFAKQGTIFKIYKKVWDTVKSGDIIAEVDAKSAKLDIASARVSLSNAQNNLDKATGKTSEVERIKATNTMLDSKARLTQLQKDYENLLIEQQDALANAKTGIITLESKLSLAKDELTYAQNNTTDTTTVSTVQQDVIDGYTLIESAYNSIYPSLNTLGEVMILENKDNPQYWAIGENNQALKTQIDDLYKKTKQARIDIEPKFLVVKNNSSSLTSVLVGLTEMQSLLGEVRTLTTLSIASVRASRVGAEINDTLIGLKITKLTTLSTELSTQYADMEAAIKTLKNVDNTSLADLGTANAIKSKQLNVDGLQSDIIKAKQSLIQTTGTYESKLLSAKQSILSQENTIILNEATYNELINGTSTDIISARNSVRSAEISLEKSNLALRDYQIISAFDGVVNNIPWIIWDTTTSTEWVLVENKGAYEIKLSLDQIDIVKIREWMRANIVLDAFPTETYTGVVSSISAVPTETSGVVSYEAIILLSLDRDDIYSKMSATVEVITTEKADTILISSSAITTENGKAYVNKATDPAFMARFSENSRTRSFIGSPASVSGETRWGFTGSGAFSGSLRGFSGGTRWGTSSGRTGWATRWTTGEFTTTESIATERVEITTGISSGGKTEVTSGLGVGDIIVTTRSSAAKPATRATGSMTTRWGQGGFGGPPPGF